MKQVNSVPPVVLTAADFPSDDDEPPQPTPAALGPAGRAHWRTVTSTFRIEPHALALLEAACRQLDVAAMAQAAADAEPWMTGLHGRLTPHPGFQLARSADLAASRLLRELGLDVEKGG